MTIFGRHKLCGPAAGGKKMEASASVVQEVVMERAGKFELLRASELTAEERKSQDSESGLKQDPENAGTSQEATPGVGLQSKESISRRLEATEETTTTSSSKPKIFIDGSGVTGEKNPSEKTLENEKPNISQCNTIKDEKCVELDMHSGEVEVIDLEKDSKTAVESIQHFDTPKHTGTTARRDLSSSSVTFVRSTSSQQRKKSEMKRTQSAPGPRVNTLAKKTADALEQKRLNEAAFSAWLTRKNEELAERRRLERAKQRDIEEQRQKKKQLSELAYQNWLEVKNKEYHSKLNSRPLTSVPKKDEEKCRLAFENWIMSKRTQHLKEMQIEQQRSQEMEEAARRADPSVIEKAYSE